MKHCEALLPSSGRKRKPCTWPHPTLAPSPCQYTRSGWDTTQALSTRRNLTWPWGDDNSSSYWWQRGMSTSICVTNDNKRLKLLIHKSCSLKWSQMRWATCFRQRCLLLDRLKYSAVNSHILNGLKGEDRNAANKVNYSTGWWIIQFFNNLNQREDYQTHGSDSHLSISGDGRVLIDAVIFRLDIPLWELYILIWMWE